MEIYSKGLEIEQCVVYLESKKIRVNPELKEDASFIKNSLTRKVVINIIIGLLITGIAGYWNQYSIPYFLVVWLTQVIFTSIIFQPIVEKKLKKYRIVEMYEVLSLPLMNAILEHNKRLNNLIDSINLSLTFDQTQDMSATKQLINQINQGREVIDKNFDKLSRINERYSSIRNLDKNTIVDTMFELPLLVVNNEVYSHEDNELNLLVETINQEVDLVVKNEISAPKQLKSL